MRKGTTHVLLSAALLLFASALPAQTRFEVSFPASASAAPLDGRLLLLLSTDDSDEPRFQINDTPKTQIVFGVNVDGWQPGAAVPVDEKAFGYPIRSLKDLPPGDYTVQAVLNRYTTFHRADGKTIKLPMDEGEGQHWEHKPGNLYSAPQKIRVSADSGLTRLVLDRTMPPVVPIPDTKYVRHIRIQSTVLTKFWGRPMFLSAVVLVPEGFDDRPQTRFPLIIFHDHFTKGFDDFRTEPPDPNLKPDYSERFHIPGYNRIVQQEGYKFYRTWTGPNFPRVLIVKLQHANPYYDDSYAVDSANVGPYGTAIETELIPAIEKRFRGIGEGWARFVYGGSTGGWESLAAQIFYPEHYNGAFVACPDPVDFHAFEVIDLYNDRNAFYLEGAHKKVSQPAMRDYLGHTTLTLQDNQAYEYALGDHGRSGEQFDVWQAVYGPVGKDGYPQPIFDKLTGDIDPKTAAYWRDHYDLTHILERDWPTHGPQLQGKLHVYVGSADTYCRNDAVYRLQEFLDRSQSPHSDAEVKYGDRAEHCWNGDPALPNYLSRLHYETMYLPMIVDRIEKSAPAGADLKSWRY